MNKHLRSNLRQALDQQLSCLAATLRPGSLAAYANIAHRFLAFLQQVHPQVRYPFQLRRHPHIWDFLQHLYHQQPPLRNATRIRYLIFLRRLLHDLPDSNHSLPELILPEDFPRPDVYLPKPLSAEEDRLLQQKLATENDLLALALRLMRATGLRIGECRNLSVDCLHPISTDQWVLKVPLGKLHTERWVPIDQATHQIIASIQTLRTPSPKYSQNAHFLLLWHGGRRPCYAAFSHKLTQAAVQAGCTSRITPHRLRHSFATEMISSGVSLPVVMQLLGHKDIRMTLHYVLVSQNDMQREYHRARHHLAARHQMPMLPVNQLPEHPPQGGVVVAQNALATAQQLLACLRLNLSSNSDRRPLARLANRLAKISAALGKL